MTAALKQEDIGFQANLYESKNPTRNWLHNERRDWVNSRLDTLSGANTTYLEIGIGCGVYTKKMANTGKVVAVDINESFVLAASHICGVEAEVADICVGPIAHAKADIALCSEVIEHVPDSPAALRNIYLSLKPGGALILTTPNSFSTTELVARLLAFRPVVKFARMVYGESVDDLGHINRLTRGALRKQLRNAGFEIVEQDNVALYLPAIAEFGGVPAVRFAKWLANLFRKSSVLSHLLWTQCWVVRRPNSPLENQSDSNGYLRRKNA